MEQEAHVTRPTRRRLSPGNATTGRRVFDSVLGAIGNTPVVRLHEVTAGVEANVFAKLEFLNPGGSLKDRVGWWLIRDAEERGVLEPGGVVIEGTGGNTGVGLAMAAAVMGYRCIFTLPDKMSDIKIRTLRAYGAEVIVTPTAVPPDDPRSYYSVAKRLARETPNALYVDQYNNLANRQYHYRYTGPEILEQMPEIDVFVAGIGTGGTIVGTGKYLKEHKPAVEVIAIDPEGSVVHDTFHFGAPREPARPYLIEGIGKEFIPRNYDFAFIDDVLRVSDKDAFLMTREILRREGIFAGVSSGAAVAAALRWMREQKARLRGKNVLIVFADSGDRYISKAYDDDWMRSLGFFDETGGKEVAPAP